MSRWQKAARAAVVLKDKPLLPRGRNWEENGPNECLQNTGPCDIMRLVSVAGMTKERNYVLNTGVKAWRNNILRYVVPMSTI